MIYLPTNTQYAKKPSYNKRVCISYLVSRVGHVLFLPLNPGYYLVCVSNIV